MMNVIAHSLSVFKELVKNAEITTNVHPQTFASKIVMDHVLQILIVKMFQDSHSVNQDNV